MFFLRFQTACEGARDGSPEVVRVGWDASAARLGVVLVCGLVALSLRSRGTTRAVDWLPPNFRSPLFNPSPQPEHHKSNLSSGKPGSPEPPLPRKAPKRLAWLLLVAEAFFFCAPSFSSSAAFSASCAASVSAADRELSMPACSLSRGSRGSRGSRVAK